MKMHRIALCAFLLDVLCARCHTADRVLVRADLTIIIIIIITR